MGKTPPCFRLEGDLFVSASDRRLHAILFAAGIYIVFGLGWTFVGLRWVGPQITAMLQAPSWLPPSVWAAESDTWMAIRSFVATLSGEIVLPLVLYLLLVRRYGLVPLLRRPVRFGAAALVSLASVAGAVAFAATQDAVLGAADAVMLLLFLGVVGPCEEWSFRGVLTRVMADRIGLLPAALVVSAAFGLNHVFEGLFVGHMSFGNDWAYIGTTALMGLIFTWVAWRSGSILWAATVHGLNDWLSVTAFQGTGLSLADNLVMVALALLGTEAVRLISGIATRRNETTMTT